MRLLPLYFAAILLLLARGTICAGEIREFDLKTTEQLGREMNRVSQQPDNGAFSLAHETSANGFGSDGITLGIGRLIRNPCRSHRALA